MRAESAASIVIVGMACRVPGADSVDAFGEMLFTGRTGYGELPPDRCDRRLYFDPVRGKPGKSYTLVGGIVPARPLNREVCPLPPDAESLFDAAHVQFAEVAALAWQHAGLIPHDRRLHRTAVYVGHSGGTKSGGGLSLGTQIEEALTFAEEIESFRQLPGSVRSRVLADVRDRIRRVRPFREPGVIPNFHAYQAAALAAKVLGLAGPRSVIDAACASSLVALAQAMLAIRAGRIDSAVVGGATYNNIDNLILFSHSQACTAADSRPFDDQASGLVSSEGYVALVIMTAATAEEHGLPVLGVVRSVGIASDGRGRSLWAPRKEGQVLALQRAYAASQIDPLDIDCMEAHATSTQLGDATELETLRTLASERRSGVTEFGDPILLGSVKSNIGHTLEAAGLIGIVKMLLAMQRRIVPPSLKFEHPNRNFEWKEAPVRVVTRPEPWPEKSLNRRARRAAVSAFGIGGLNAHAVLEEAPERAPSGPAEQRRAAATVHAGFDSSAPSAAEPVAIVGRGVIVAGAGNLREFRSLLESGRSVISEAPADRWKKQAGVVPGGNPASHTAPHCRGGFVTDFRFNGAKYRIPPRQVQQANPVQMMLIEAVSEAFSEMQTSTRRDEWPVDRQRVGVVVGTIFGGEFGDQLQVGMRLPEICREMSDSLQRSGCSADLAQKTTESFRQTVLRHRPALLDETGSFTASTLASRVAKTFDLMGGAAALDSDDASGLTALMVATDQLRSGLCDMVVCGSAQRSLSLAAFEALDLTGRLVRSGNPYDVPEDCQQIIPGEGVVALMLCRLSDARRLGLPVFGLLNPVCQADSRTASVLNADDARLVRQIGYLAGAHSLVRIIAETAIRASQSTDRTTPRENSRTGLPDRPISISAKACDGIVLQTQLSNYSPDPVSGTLSSPSGIDREPGPIRNTQVVLQTPMSLKTASTKSNLRCIRFAATSLLQLQEQLQKSLQTPTTAFAEQRILRGKLPSAASADTVEFQPQDRFRAAIVAASESQLADRIGAALKAAKLGRSCGVLDRDRVVLWETADEAPRVAWLFPGQGSHYPDAPAVLAGSDTARTVIGSVDDHFAKANLPRLSTAFGNSSVRPGDDVWWAQAWVLGVSTALTAVLKAEGLRPDVVLGHSFGEFTAAVAAGVATLTQTIDLARHRANAVMSHMRTPGGLLSVRAAVHEVDSILKSAALPVYVTHLNSPRQTVIAGGREGIEAAKTLLESRSLAAMSIPVPAPFHTPLLADAEVAFERMSASVPLQPPVCGFLSATCVQYLAEPSAIRHSLVRQLTQPVMYLPSIQRMAAEGVRVFLEVGPNDVLTRMNRDILESRSLCLSVDVPGQPFEERLMLVHAALECVLGRRCGGAPAGPETESSASGSLSAALDAPVFDVTRSRKVTRKSEPLIETIGAEPATVIVASSVVASVSHAEPETTSEQPVRTRPDSVAGHPPSGTAVGEEQLRMFTRDLVVELTGYSPDIVDFDADLEADLGIDSIKKAQILGELGEWLGLTVRPDSLRLDSVRTLEDAIRVTFRLAEDQLPASASPESRGPLKSRAIDEPVRTLREQVPAAGRQPRIAGSLPEDEKLDELLIDYVVDQTGYGRDVVDIDADLEADLGLDSIKLAQLIGEMREQFQLESLTLESISQTRFHSLREIREFLVAHVSRHADAERRSLPNFAGSERVSRPAIADSEPLASGESESGKSVASPVTSAEIRGLSVIRTLPDAVRPHRQSGESTATILQRTQRIGEQTRSEIRSALRTMIAEFPNDSNRSALTATRLLAEDSSHWRGIAIGAGVSELSLQAAAGRFFGGSSEQIARDSAVRDGATDPVVSQLDASPAGGTKRFALRVVPAPRRAGMPLEPELRGPALILGANPVAVALADRIRWLGQQAVILDTAKPLSELERIVEELREQPLHVFLTMAFDPDAAGDLSGEEWVLRRPAALEAPFRICQIWMQQTIDAGRMEDASVVAVTQLGGDFGFSGRHVRSFEAIGGLVKAMLIEAWMRGYRTTPMKVVDAASSMTPPEIVNGVLQELAVPSYDMEIAFRSSANPAIPERCSVQALPAPLRTDGKSVNGSSVGSFDVRASTVVRRLADSLATSPKSETRLSRGSTWIVSGGGRGITAVIAMTLARKYDLKLHLLGTAPVPALSDDFVERVAADRAGVRRQIMHDASARGENPVEAWRNTEKAIEIDETLRSCRKQQISAVYHCCDVADYAAVDRTISGIRRQAGMISGVIHGAGAGQDARFDRKRPEKVEKCLRAKIDGTLALIQATRTDPLEWFVTFGSISGRFGANGHTDYSLANDMMAKIVDRYRSERPDVRSLTFHWHAWGDIGMATKPEAKLALEMIDMEFMPARDGIDHFMRELEFGGDEPEVLITDENYFRKFFPAERLSVTNGAGLSAPTALNLPLIPAAVSWQEHEVSSSVVTLNPLTDRFLSQHRVQGRPTLPFVVAIELMAEAVRARTGGKPIRRCLQARAAQAIRFAADDPLAVTLQTRPTDGGIECRLLADVRRRDGRMVEEDREYFRAVFESGEPESLPAAEHFSKPSGLNWKRIEYADPESLIYHGPEFQELREIADEGTLIWGRIAASAPVQLFGGNRARGFTVACSTMDACLYAIGYVAWSRYQKPSLPVRFDSIEPCRLPDPGEPCLLRVQEVQAGDSGAVWNFQLQGHNGDRLLTVSGYRIGWLKGS